MIQTGSEKEFKCTLTKALNSKLCPTSKMDVMSKHVSIRHASVLIPSFFFTHVCIFLRAENNQCVSTLPEKRYAVSFTHRSVAHAVRCTDEAMLHDISTTRCLVA